MQYIEAPSEDTPLHPTVFLAGGIMNCPNWQAKIVDLLKDIDVTLYNPRRKNYPMDDPAAVEEQIAWEHDRLRSADVRLFWFADGSVQPIVLFELGAALERGGHIVIGVDPAYARKIDVGIQTHLQRTDAAIHTSLAAIAVVIGDMFNEE